MDPRFEEWATSLSSAVTEALDEFRPHLGGAISIFALDCHPWNGHLGLAVLTEAENPWLRKIARMAEWLHFDFDSHLESWKSPSTRDLLRQMRTSYDAAKPHHAAIADQYFRACAIALTASNVQTAIRRYRLSPDFRISVAHPDRDEEFYPPR